MALKSAQLVYTYLYTLDVGNNFSYYYFVRILYLNNYGRGIMSQVGRLSVSLPRYLISVADEIANERGVSRSKVVASCLQELAEKHKIAEMEEGYRVMAEENKRFAKMAFELQRRVVPEWE